MTLTNFGAQQVPSQPVRGDVQVFFDDQVTLVRLSGEVDLALGPELEDAGRDAIDRGEPVTIDTSQVTFIDSTGLGFIARLVAAGNAVGCPPRMVGATQLVVESVALVGMTGLLAW